MGFGKTDMVESVLTSIAELVQISKGWENLESVTPENNTSSAIAMLFLCIATLAKEVKNIIEEGVIVVTTNENGECILVSRQDEEGRILKIIWEKK